MGSIESAKMSETIDKYDPKTRLAITIRAGKLDNDRLRIKPRSNSFSPYTNTDLSSKARLPQNASEESSIEWDDPNNRYIAAIHLMATQSTKKR